MCGSETRIFARFMVDRRETRPDRPGLYYPSASTNQVSVYNTDHATGCDVIDAGNYVVKIREKPALFGWSYVAECSLAELGLYIIHNQGKDFGGAIHMDICGWPQNRAETIKKAKRLVELEHDYKILEKPILRQSVTC